MSDWVSLADAKKVLGLSDRRLNRLIEERCLLERWFPGSGWCLRRADVEELARLIQSEVRGQVGGGSVAQ